MPTIHLTTFIAAPAQVVFDLSRHVGLHKESIAAQKEEAVAGTRFRLIEKEDTVAAFFLPDSESAEAITRLCAFIVAPGLSGQGGAGRVAPAP